MSQVQTSQDTPKYARFTRRVQALMYDSMILVVVLALTLFLATSAEGIGASREIGFAGAAIILLYEPVLVAWRGGTLGHSLRNLRVVDDRTRGNIGFLKAVARFVIKLPLGLLSFLTMATTQRHQAIHDLLTGSTVRIRNESQADLLHYHVARTEFADGTMPSRLRRSVAILAYLLLAIAAASLVTEVLAGNLITTACLNNESLCTGAEELTLNVIGLGILALCAVVIVMGWRGKLPGCRRKAKATSSRSQASSQSQANSHSQ
jgi:uncharacterized RDD family membrane protein YckC